MADVLLSLEDVSKQLQLSKDQIVEMVKKGILRGFLDQKTYKFRSGDVDAFKKKLASGATTLSDGPAKSGSSAGGGKKDSTSKIDLTEVESDSGVEDTDQTSVLAPVEPGEPKSKHEETPVFKFGEKDLPLDEEHAPALEEGDQTSLLVPGSKEEKGKEDAKAEFNFADKGLKLPEDDDAGDAGDSVLVADESESSMDILEVAEESSSDSASSASGIVFSDEASSGEEIPSTGSESAIKVAPKPAAKPGPKPGEPTTDKVVTDILGPAAEDSDEALETLDVDEVVETKEAVGKETGVKPETTATVPVGDEYETVGLPGAEETKSAVTEAGDTSTIDGAVADALQEQAAEEEPEEEAEEAGAVVPTGWETAQSWMPGNILLVAATVILVLGGAVLFLEAFGIHNGVTAALADFAKNHLH